ncbi:MAG: DUF4345 family protein [Devosia sp.]
MWACRRPPEPWLWAGDPPARYPQEAEITHPNYVLRGVLALVGAVIVFLGLNVSLGGIQTMGWQGGVVSFVEITDANVFAIRDDHFRFIGGVWLGLGLLTLAASVAFRQLRSVVVAFAAIVFVGGLARFSGGNLQVPLSLDVAPSLAFELIAMPLIGLWATRAERT